MVFLKLSTATFWGDAWCLDPMPLEESMALQQIIMGLGFWV